MRILRATFILGALGLLVLAQSGCVAAAACAGAGCGIAYVRGASVMTFEGTPQQVGQATEEAFSQLGVAVISSRLNENGAEIVARTRCDDKVTVCIDARSCNLSRVSVRLGIFGDRYFQNRVLSTISDNLRSPMPAMEVAPEVEMPGEEGSEGQ